MLRICSVFEPPDAALAGRGARFDPVGGMQSHTGQLTRALDERGVHQLVITHRPPGAEARQLLGRNATVHRFGLPIPWARQVYSLPAAVAALRLVPGVHVVHAHLGEDLAVLPIGLAAARRASAPLVVTVHSSLRHTFTGTGPRAWLLRTAGARIEHAVCRRSDAVIALTARLAALVREDGLPPERVHVIPSGVRAAAFAGEHPDPFPDAGHPRVVFVGRLARQKGVRVLVEAAARMRTPGVRVLFVGDGPERAGLEEAIAGRGVADRVRITGFRPHREIPAILRHADIFCLPSIYEELGSALLEAMQAGVPIVASATGGIPDAVGPAARLVPAGDPAALAAALDDLLADPNEARRLSALAVERVSAWDWDRLADRIHELYERLSARRPGQPPQRSQATKGADHAGEEGRPSEHVGAVAQEGPADL